MSRVPPLESDCEEGRATRSWRSICKEVRDERKGGVITGLSVARKRAAAVISGGIALAATGVSTAANIVAVVGGYHRVYIWLDGRSRNRHR